MKFCILNEDTSVSW